MVLSKAKQWLNPVYDEETRNRVQYLIDNDPKELDESFYRDLEFGTGGLRGIMGVGTNRMNIYTVAMATQGLCNYLKKTYPGELLKAAIAYDSRNNSALFASKTAEIFSANGFMVYLFKELRPTPQLSFAIRHYGCHTGVVVTASHNPKEYNGYKVYWNDGGQLVAPHDKNIIVEVQAIKGIEDVNFDGIEKLILTIKDDIDAAYIEKMKLLSLSSDAIKRQSDLKIVYTSLHGTGITLAPRLLKEYGFTNVLTVAEQDKPDGNFPTVHSPNPEEPAALALALKKAEAENADLVMGTDPDSDRVGIAVRDNDGKFILLNGNQTGSLLVYYLLRRWHELGKLDGKQFVAKTIVTTSLIEKIADTYNVECYDVLTGFKFIAELIKSLEGKKQFIGGGEESYGYLAGDFVRDKDAILSCALIAEMTAWAKDNGKTVYNLLIDVYLEFGFYKEGLLSLTKKGKDGSEEISRMMEQFRTTPPTELDGSKVLQVKDYKNNSIKDTATGNITETGLPKSDVMQFVCANGTIVTVRPSGTEPKIKFYFSICGNLQSREYFEKENAALDARIENLKKVFSA
jgi:phosphoglucomutase